jgi:hypothetical protein
MLPRKRSFPICSIVSCTRAIGVEPMETQSTTPSEARASGIVARFLIERVAR